MKTEIGAETFAYWLNGFFENVTTKTLNEAQTNAIRSHLNLLFEKKAESVVDTDKVVEKVLNTNPYPPLNLSPQTLIC